MWRDHVWIPPTMIGSKNRTRLLVHPLARSPCSVTSFITELLTVSERLLSEWFRRGRQQTCVFRDSGAGLLRVIDGPRDRFCQFDAGVKDRGPPTIASTHVMSARHAQHAHRRAAGLLLTHYPRFAHSNGVIPRIAPAPLENLPARNEDVLTKGPGRSRKLADDPRPVPSGADTPTQVLHQRGAAQLRRWTTFPVLPALQVPSA